MNVPRGRQLQIYEKHATIDNTLIVIVDIIQLGGKRQYMEREQPQRTWQALLADLIDNSRERQRIAQQVRVRPITLQRWANLTSRPRDEHIDRLLSAISRESYQEFFQALKKDYPTLIPAHQQIHKISPEIPAELYDRVLSACAMTSPFLYFQTICELILRQAIEHLDPDRCGMAINLVSCVKPLLGGKVRSLREIAGMGTPPWSRNIGQHTSFLGAESLCGAAVVQCRIVSIQDRNEPNPIFPAHWVTNEQSAVAYPLLRQTRVAGCLLVSSAHPYTLTEIHCEVIKRYANLLALAFAPADFFDTQEIWLQLMPPYEEQILYFQNFRQRVNERMWVGANGGPLLTYQDAQESIWLEVEEELLQHQATQQARVDQYR